MAKEVPDPLKLHFDDKIEQFWLREDKPGVIFPMNTESLNLAVATIQALSLAPRFLGFDFIPVGPLELFGLLK
jgi:hypothetical protein